MGFERSVEKISCSIRQLPKLQGQKSAVKTSMPCMKGFLDFQLTGAAHVAIMDGVFVVVMHILTYGFHWMPADI